MKFFTGEDWEEDEEEDDPDYDPSTDKKGLDAAQQQQQGECKQQ